jgi:hypothetical protein
MTIEEKREKNRIKNIIWRKNNKEKYIQSVANYRKKYPDRIKDCKLKERYNITLNQYNEMFQKQNGKCAICGNEESALHNYSKKVQKLAVDHCHKTGKIRALLCRDCNRGLGKFREDILILNNAIEYLKTYDK